MEFQPPVMNLRFGSGSEATDDNRRALADGRLATPTLPSFDEVVAKYPAFSAALTVYAAGSVVQGWGHANSDLDLYIVSEDHLDFGARLESFTRHVSTSDPVIHIVLGEFGPFRADMELWRGEQIDEIIGRFAGRLPDQEAPELDKSEQDMLYRLASGQPLHGADWWAARRDALRGSGYGLWLAENRKLIAETFLEDVGGLLVSRDHETAVLAAHEAFTGALEAVLAVNGDYSVNRKWLYRRLSTYTPKQIDVSDAWSALTMVGAKDDPRGWAERTARTAQRLLLSDEEAAAL
jgi:hypothetical protein